MRPTTCRLQRPQAAPQPIQPRSAHGRLEGGRPGGGTLWRASAGPKLRGPWMAPQRSSQNPTYVTRMSPPFWKRTITLQPQA